MFCKKCGNKIDDNAVFCQICGNKADTTDPQTESDLSDTFDLQNQEATQNQNNQSITQNLNNNDISNKEPIQNNNQQIGNMNMQNNKNGTHCRLNPYPYNRSSFSLKNKGDSNKITKIKSKDCTISEPGKKLLIGVGSGLAGLLIGAVVQKEIDKQKIAEDKKSKWFNLIEF